MLRILLVVDDYGELLFLQTLLKKLGFDVDGIQNERSFEESFLALNPDIILATAKGKRIDGMELAGGLKKVRGMPKVILLAGKTMLEKLRGLQITGVDGVIETPVAASQLLGEIARLGGLDGPGLLDKYRKLKVTLSTDEEADLQILRRDDEDGVLAVTGRETQLVKPAVLLKPTTMSEADRQSRFSASIVSLPKPQVNNFDRDRIREFTRKIRREEDPKESADLEAERRSFVKALFRKARGQ